MARSRPEAGRFSRAEVDAFVSETWAGVDALVRRAELGELPSVGNRHNVFLAVVTMAAYRALLDRGIERDYAMELFADVGWKVYAGMLKLPVLLGRLRRRDTQSRMNATLEALMRFPFDAPGRPGYEVEAWADADGYHTHWSYCAPLGFVQRLIEREGDRGELEAFARSWCTYDWPAADLLAGGRSPEGSHYTRLHTLSHGDAVCDMCWSARPRCPVRGRASASAERR